ncbi:MAG: hypothetical protein IT380_07310 [Myxococcales bacterium]|nr:hypothetical protein [Myxococcales bacterium]
MWAALPEFGAPLIGETLHRQKYLLSLCVAVLVCASNCSGGPSSGTGGGGGASGGTGGGGTGGGTGGGGTGGGGGDVMGTVFVPSAWPVHFTVANGSRYWISNLTAGYGLNI